MARLDGIDDNNANLLTRQVYRVAKNKAGAVPEPLRLMAHCPPVMFAVGGFETAFGKANRVDPVLKDLCQLKVAAMIGCMF